MLKSSTKILKIDYDLEFDKKYAWFLHLKVLTYKSIKQNIIYMPDDRTNGVKISSKSMWLTHVILLDNDMSK